MTNEQREDLGAAFGLDLDGPAGEPAHTPTPEPARPAERVKPGPNEAPDFDELRREFESELADTPADQPTEQAAEQTPAPDAPDGRSFDEVLADLASAHERTLTQLGLQRDYTALQAQAEAIKADLSNKIDAADFRGLLQDMRCVVSEDDVSDQVLTEALVGRYYANPQTQEVWERRYQDPARFARHVETIAAELRQQFAPRYDAAATEDRQAITAFMRGERGPRPAPAFPRNINSMSDPDFKRTLDRMGIDSERTRL